ncbi:hypothetical protein TYRP_018158 [Tyrophagus putrescentiae]|nr:hypothetical protein TYRP_018158 [Tyrophagus putrescentiae]
MAAAAIVGQQRQWQPKTLAQQNRHASLHSSFEPLKNSNNVRSLLSLVTAVPTSNHFTSKRALTTSATCFKMSDEEAKAQTAGQTA